MELQNPKNTSEKLNLLDFDLADLREFFLQIGEKPFRAQQVIQWVHQYGVEDFEKMTNLSKPLRERLQSLLEVRRLKIAYDHTSQDGTRKWLMQLPEGNRVETVFIPETDRGTLCISSQVGCALNCTFCATASQGFNRNLSVGEIIGQVFHAVHTLKQEGGERRITNVVLMGMGEPLLNYDNVLKAINLMLEDFAYGLSKYRVTLSTSGVVPYMPSFVTQSEAALAISLHAPNDALRNQLVPINKKYDLSQLIGFCRKYFPAGAKRSVTFEYVMLAGVNDQPEHARQLVKLLRGLNCKMNLIPFNPFKLSRYQCSSLAAITTFRDILVKARVVTTVRKTRGDDIAAACGQLVGDFKDRTTRSARYIKKFTEERVAAQ